MTYLFAIVALGMLAVVAYQIYSVVKTDQKRVDSEMEDEPSVLDSVDYYKREQSDLTNFEWQSTTTAEEPITYTFAGTTETQAVEVKEEKPKKKKSYYKRKDKNPSKVITTKASKKKKGGKDDLLLS